MVDYEKIVAAPINLDLDYEKITHELMNELVNHKCVPFTYPPERGSNEKVTAYSLFLRSPQDNFDYSYRGSKSADFAKFNWNSEIEIPYTKSCIENIPFTKLGTVRAVYFPDIPCVEHTDWDNVNDLEHTLGLSIIPSTGDTHCKIWIDKLCTYVEIPGNTMLLNDSVKHFVPKSTGTRIAIRIFGSIDYSYFDDKIVWKHAYTHN